MGKEGVIKVLTKSLDFVRRATSDDDVKEALFGTYADGRVRNATDAIKGEYQSPKMKKKLDSKKKKKNKYKYTI